MTTLNYNEIICILSVISYLFYCYIEIKTKEKQEYEKRLILLEQQNMHLMNIIKEINDNIKDLRYNY